MANILINGVSYGWANLTLVLFGSPVIGITKINYESDQKKENLYGWNNQPIQRGYGNVDYTNGSLELYVEEWIKICNKAPFGDPLQIPYFSATVVYTKNGQVVTDVLFNMEFTKNAMSSNQGDTSIKIQVPFIFAGMNRFI